MTRTREAVSNYVIGLLPSFIAVIFVLSSLAKVIDAVEQLNGRIELSLTTTLFVVMANLSVATAVLFRPSRATFLAVSVVVLTYLVVSLWSWLNKVSCNCFGQLISSGFVVILDSVLLLASIACARATVSGLASPRVRYDSLLVGSALAMTAFLTLVYLSDSRGKIALRSAWNTGSLVGKELKSVIDLSELPETLVSSNHLHVFLYDTGCRICVNHWERTSTSETRREDYPNAVAIWQQADRSWIAMDFDSPPTAVSLEKHKVRFPHGIPYVHTPTILTVINSRIARVEEL